MTTARDLTADVVRSLARSGPRRFYVLNTGDSSAQALAAAAKLLASDGILLHYTDWRAHVAATRGMQRQPGGNHADEIETSMMLYIDPSAVNMRSAQPDYNPAVSTPFQLTRREGGRGTYSPTGAWGDPTLATRDKGRVVVEGLVSAIRTDIETLRKASLPIAGPAAATPAPASVRPRQSTPSRPTNGECQPGDDRTIRAIGPAFQLAWANQDVDRIVSFWSAGGDMAHPDGLVESNAKIIGENRAYLFRQPEYRHSRHYLAFGTIRCITPDVAIADAKWELRGHDRRQGRTGAVGRGPVHAGGDAPTRPLADRGLALQREARDTAERANLPQEARVPAPGEMTARVGHPTLCGAGGPLDRGTQASQRGQ